MVGRDIKEADDGSQADKKKKGKVNENLPAQLKLFPDCRVMLRFYIKYKKFNVIAINLGVISMSRMAWPMEDLVMLLASRDTKMANRSVYGSDLTV